MKRFLFVLVFILAVPAYANTFDRVMDTRNAVQQRLNLSASQEEARKEINANFYKEVKPKVDEIDVYVKRIEDIAKSEHITREKIDSVRKEFEAAESELFEINRKYEREFRSILNPYQTLKYTVLKKQAGAKLKKELKAEIKKQKI